MKKKILVVDNDPVVLRLMANFLEKKGHQVLTAEDGLFALDVLKTHTPDVIFIDLVMPNISGEKLCRIIRSMPGIKDVYLVILSAIAAEETTDFAQFGANACIAKAPFNEIAENILTVIDQSDHANSRKFSEKIIGFENISARQVTRELLSSKRHVEAILDNMSEGFIELSLKGTIIFTNAAAISLTGISEEKLLASDFTELFHGIHRKIIKDLLTMVGDMQQTVTKESPVILNGKQVSLIIIPVKDKENSSIAVILNDITERMQVEESLLKEKERLQDALDKVRTLSGMFPICASCKKIRDDKGYWNQIEVYIRDHSEAEFSHSICPECVSKLYPEYYEED